jgi:hypothetical protein
MSDSGAPASEPSRLAVGSHVSLTALAAVDRAPKASHFRGELEIRFLTVLEAGWAKPMRWFFAASRWLEHLSECPAPHLFQFITLLLSFPV